MTTEMKTVHRILREVVRRAPPPTNEPDDERALRKRLTGEVAEIVARGGNVGLPDDDEDAED